MYICSSFLDLLRFTQEPFYPLTIQSLAKWDGLALLLIKSFQYLTFHTMKLKPKAAENKLAFMVLFVLTIQNLLPSRSTANKVVSNIWPITFSRETLLQWHKNLSHSSVKIQHLRNPHTQISSGILIRNGCYNQIYKLLLLLLLITKHLFSIFNNT